MAAPSGWEPRTGGGGGRSPSQPPPNFPSHLLPWVCLGLWPGAISKCATDSWSQAGLSKVSTSPIFSDLPGRSCSQSPGQTPPILGKQMYTIALSLSIRFYHSFQQARNRQTIQLSVARRWGGGGSYVAAWAWLSSYSFSLSLNWHHFIIHGVCPRKDETWFCPRDK